MLTLSARPARILIINTFNCFHERFPRLPMVQITNDFSIDSLLKYCIMLTMADTALANIIPSMRTVIISRTLTDTIIISSSTSPDPSHAAATMAQLLKMREILMEITDERPRTRMATPRLAPELMPRT